MAISSVQPATNLGLSSALGGNTALGKDDFLTLLVTQLQNQDPMNPEDPTEFTAQLAQFSSLEQLFGVNEQLGKMAAASGDIERLSALNLIGKEVVSESGNFELGSAEVNLGYHLDSAVAGVTLHVQNARGQVVASIPATEVGPGDHFVSWNGTTSAGGTLPAGSYTVTATADTTGDETQTLKSLVRSNVRGVDLDRGGSLLLTDAGSFRMSDIASVREI